MVRSGPIPLYLLAIALIVMPFLFGFSDEDAPTTWFMAVGVVHLLMTIATRFLPPDDAGSDRHGRGGIGALAYGTSVDVEAGQHTVLDD